MAAAGSGDPVSEQDIKDLLKDALDNPPPGQVQQVIDCLVLAGLISNIQIIVNTFITSAIDGNGAIVPPEGSTTSNDITFGFSGQITPEGTELLAKGLNVG